MKKIFLFIILIISLRGISQFPLNATNGTNTSGVLTRGRLSVDSLLQINTTCFADTIAANRGRIDEIAGAIIRLCNNSLMLRNNTATAWIGLGGAGTISTINFYSDSSLIICYGNGVCDTISFNNTINNSITNIYNNSIVNIFVYNDSCVVLQQGDGTNVDTICTVFTCGITGWTITGTGSIQICGFICPDTTTEVCHTYTFPPQSFYLFSNWLTQVSPGNVEAGGGLKHNTTFNTQNYVSIFGGYPYGRYPVQVFQQQSALGSPGLQSWLHGYGVEGANNVPLSVIYSDSIYNSTWNGWFGSNPGYAIVSNLSGYGNFSSGPTNQSLNLSNNNSKIAGIYFGTMNGSTPTLAGSLFGAATTNASTIATLNGKQVLNWHTNGRVQLPQYVNIADAATDSAFYKDPTDGTMKYGKVNTGATTPAGNYGDIQINRNNVFSTPASDSLIYNSARLTVLGHQTITSANVSGTTTSASLVLNANSLTSGTGFYGASSTLQNGSLVNLAVTGTAASGNFQKALYVTTSGANANSGQTTYGGLFLNTHTGISSQNVALYAEASGGSSSNYAINTFLTSNVGAGILSQVSGLAPAILGQTSASSAGTSISIYGVADGAGTATVAIGGQFEAAGATGGNYAIIVPSGKGSVGIGNSAPTSTLDVTGGSFGLNYVGKTANYTLTAADYLVNFTANADTATLPTAVGITGRIYTIKTTGSACIVATTSSQNIDASTTYALSAQYKYVTVMSNGANWIIIANNDLRWLVLLILLPTLLFKRKQFYNSIKQK